MSAPTETDRTAEQAKMLESFGFTERQARFLVLVLLHSGVFMGRQYATFAGITHGQKVHNFVERLPAGRFATAHRIHGRMGDRRPCRASRRHRHSRAQEGAANERIERSALGRGTRATPVAARDAEARQGGGAEDTDTA